MAERLFLRLWQHYILFVMIATRLFGSVGGLLVIYYVELALWLPPQVRLHFRLFALVVVVIGSTLTVLLALWETRKLRDVLRRIRLGERPSRECTAAAGREAVTFVGRHHWHEAWLVPCSTLVPMLIFLRIMDDASATILINITLTVFMGISMALMSTFFAVEHFIQPVILYLIDYGAPIEYNKLPAGRLRFRMSLCSTLIIMTTALMIGTLAIQRTTEIAGSEGSRADAAANLRQHCIYITIAAVCTGVVFSQVLGHSIVSRVHTMVHAMEHVAAGSMSERLKPTGTDEIDRMARQFNVMVQRLEHNNLTIQDLNTNLENKVRSRTRQLENALQELRDTQTQLTDVARRAGMAEIATGVLHNVGNVLNSVNVSTSWLSDQLRKSKLGGLRRTIEQLTEHADDLGSFLNAENRGHKLLDYLNRLDEVLTGEHQALLQELSSLGDKVQHIKGIITTQQSYAKRVHFREQVDVVKLIEDVLVMHHPSIVKYGIDIIRDYQVKPVAFLEKSNLAQVLENLVKNAVEAMADPRARARVLTIQIESLTAEAVRVTVGDTGCGIDTDSLKSIFAYGFTTKPKGSGFGLHSSALAISTIGGKIHAESDGAGQGARFIIEFPLVSTDHPEFTAPENNAPPSLASLGGPPLTMEEPANLLLDPRL